MSLLAPAPLPPCPPLLPGFPLYRAAGLRALEAAARGQPLMERAGLAAADLAADLITGPRSEGPILILAGPGNNGGDAYVAARHLQARFFPVHLVALGDPSQAPADARVARQAFLDAGGSELTAIPEHAPQTHWALIIDGLLGIGLQRPLTGAYASAVAAANHLAKTQGCPLLALDCPSGLDGDTGRVLGPAIQASHTLSFIAHKPGLLTLDGPDHSGILHLAPLELDAPRLVPPEGHSIGREALVAHLLPRLRNSHKGSFGSAGILGGARGMTGAALLAGRAALLLGTGRVFVGLADDSPGAPTFDPLQAELMLRPADSLCEAPLTALAIGPGLGQSPQARLWLSRSLATDLPLVLDADALNLLAADPTLAQALATREAASLLTPHPAEAARLLGCEVAAVQANRITAAQALSQQFAAWVALKGAGTVVAAPDGRWWINTSGNPGQAAAGQGDILTGITAALLAQGWEAGTALLGAVHLHGAAADYLAGTGIGPAGLTASETAVAARTVFNAWSQPPALSA